MSNRDPRPTVAISPENKAKLAILGELMGAPDRSGATSGLGFLVKHFYHAAVAKLSQGMIEEEVESNEIEVPQPQVPVNRPTLGGQGYFS